VVSHDQAFLRAVCEEVIELDADRGQLIPYHDGYDEYIGTCL
jgi:ATPase subunit of ABC transporter with duplicated ATPase domains